MKKVTSQIWGAGFRGNDVRCKNGVIAFPEGEKQSRGAPRTRLTVQRLIYHWTASFASLPRSDDREHILRALLGSC